jgi:hypothetical protein
MKRILFLALAGILAAMARAEETDAAIAPGNRISPDDPAWSELSAGLRQRTAVTAEFTERRFFSFKKTPTILQGEVRISAEHGLSLHYVRPEEHTVIIDRRGVLLRLATGDSVPPAEPGGGAANDALLHALRLDLGQLAKTFDLYGSRAGAAWTLALVPRAADLRRTLGRITLGGEGATVRRIELRRSATQRVEISVQPPRPAGPFTAEEIRRYFR